uniref:Peptidase M50B-like protein n=1 Tax=Lotus japonicus TaxID=34305 RepID=I3S0K7_LOTJA|nr:unknown [Lotus japonicus]
MPNWELKNCCDHDQKVFLACVAAFTVVILVLWRTVLLTPFKFITVFLHEASHAIACLLTCGKVEGIQVHANEGGSTQTRGGIYWVILPAGYLGSSFWGMALILASTNILTARIAAGCFIAALVIVLFVAKNWTLRGLCIGFIIFIVVIWLLQEKTEVRALRYVILFIGVMNSLFSVYDIYDDLISRRVHSSDAEKFAEVCPCPCNGIGWGVILGDDIIRVSLWIFVPWTGHIIMR